MIFPHPSQASPEGIVAVGGELSLELIQEAYANGIFPWPHDGLPLLWFSPDPRGILIFEKLHVPRSLKKEMKKNSYTFTVSQDFQGVIKACETADRGGQGTWITPEMRKAYIELFEKGGALSVECWEGPTLVGGIYGVLSKNYFSAESMFFVRSNCGKMCFVKLVEHLQCLGHTWMDVQMVTEVVGNFGAELIHREKFLNWIGVS